MPDGTVTPETEYEGGFDTADEAAHFTIRADADDARVALHIQTVTKGFGVASIYQPLTPAEARELALAFERAAEAAEASATEQVAA